MNRHAVSHRPYSEECYGLDENHALLRFRCARGDARAARVFYRDRMAPDGEWPLAPVSAPMALIASDALFDHFEVVLANPPARLAYYFEITGDETAYLTEEGLSDSPPALPEFNKYFELHYNHREDLPHCAPWLQEAVIYQIFPDSFATGKRVMAVSPRKLRRADGGESVAERGGTLRGIIENLDYIHETGFTCLYLNPIFAAGTPHRYDTADYYAIDPLLGDKADFKELVGKAHALGIKVLLDGVFNHSGTRFFAFQDVLKNGAASAYRDWFYKMDEFPLDMGGHGRKPNYATFAYVGHMPKLNMGCPAACRYFLDVITYWVKEFDIDGWRLDVADEVNVGFWRQARAEMQAVKPDTVLIGEIWGDARRWMEGDMFDSLMNYAVMYACRRFLNGEIDAAAFGDLVGAQLMRYKKPYQYAQMNLLDSHDTERFLGMVQGSVDAYKLALTYQFLHVGAPSVYYGDELGLAETENRLWRQTMPWAREQHELRAHIQGLIQLRARHMNAIKGAFIQRHAQGRVYAFERAGEGDRLLVILNASPAAATAEIDGCGTVALAPWEARVIGG